MKYRKLRIVWSVAWGLLAVLLIALWVRSYSCCDIYASSGHNIAFLRGSFCLDATIQFEATAGTVVSGKFFPASSPAHLPAETSTIVSTDFSIRLVFLLVASVAAAALSWLPHRFSLRTLLIATTLIAVMLGLVVWAMR